MLFRYLNIDKGHLESVPVTSLSKQPVGGFQEGCFAVQDHFLFRLNNSEDCQVLDIFNIEFCESPVFALESAISDRLMSNSPCFSF